MKPTAIKPRTATLMPLPAEAGTGQLPVPAANNAFLVQLEPEEQELISRELAKVDFGVMPLRDIALLGHEQEEGLHRVLDQFLARIDRFDNPQLFKLFRDLNHEIDQEKLPELADKILNGKPGWWEQFLLLFQSRKAREAAMQRIFEETQGALKGSTTSLMTAVNRLENELRVKQRELDGEITSMEQLKDAYRDQFRDFAVAAAFQHALLQQARQYVAERTAAADLNDPTQKAEIDELNDKLQALESRALATEGMMSRLPADQLVIRQLQNAGISTLQETTTTAAQRFASIKMTLLTLNGALVTQGVQRMGQQNAALDRNLQTVQQKVMKEVVATAANAPGDNRVQQAKQLQEIVQGSKELQAIVDSARATNQQKFAEARTMFEAARKELVTVGRQVRPGDPLKR